jgi:hypothetical protein
MDAIRKRQIAEVLDENKAIGSMVLALERKYVDLDTENPLPYSQLNTEILEATTNGVNSLLVLLERKRAETHNCLQNYHPQRYLKKSQLMKLEELKKF